MIITDRFDSMNTEHLMTALHMTHRFVFAYLQFSPNIEHWHRSKFRQCLYQLLICSKTSRRLYRLSSKLTRLCEEEKQMCTFLT